MSFNISESPRVRRSPFFDSTIEDGVVSFLPYNKMLLPTGYGDPRAEYERLIKGVAMWDVAAQRQIQISGPDACKLVQVLTPRKLDQMTPGVGWYTAICNHAGTIINDPVLLKHAEDKYWFSIADSDMLLWSRAIAHERGFNVTICEPDVSPLAIQGPYAEDVVAALLGEEIRSIRHFRFEYGELDTIPMIVARSGWSKQGGFELYLMNSAKGSELWQRVKQAGKPFDIGPGCPNPTERIESGLLSYGGDTDDETNPFEVRLERYIHLDVPDDVIGVQALRKIYADGVRRHQLGIFINSDKPLGYSNQYSQVIAGSEVLGKITAQSWSPRLKKNIGLCLVSIEAQPGDDVMIKLHNGYHLEAQLTVLPFL